MSLQCYNRGCGQKYDNDTSNNADSCCHHPGEPFFHDAYKGWSCCRKKCTDFTEFLNIRGCTTSKHSNAKPPQTEKPAIINASDEVVVKSAIKLPRPRYDAELVSLRPTVCLVVRDCVGESVRSGVAGDVGRACTNAGCGAVWAGEVGECVYHPGAPVFHEGMKYWSCCRRRTSDFGAFLAQQGCERGAHVWRSEEEKTSNQVECKWDHHQTNSHVFVSIYSRKYCPQKTTVQLSPVRLKVCVVFPQRDSATFILDIELHGVIDVSLSSVHMFGSKIEVGMRKGEVGGWARLDVPVTGELSEGAGVSDDITPGVAAVHLD